MPNLMRIGKQHNSAVAIVSEIRCWHWSRCLRLICSKPANKYAEIHVKNPTLTISESSSTLFSRTLYITVYLLMLLKRCCCRVRSLWVWKCVIVLNLESTAFDQKLMHLSDRQQKTHPRKPFHSSSWLLVVFSARDWYRQRLWNTFSLLNLDWDALHNHRKKDHHHATMRDQRTKHCL